MSAHFESAWNGTKQKQKEYENSLVFVDDDDGDDDDGDDSGDDVGGKCNCIAIEWNVHERVARTTKPNNKPTVALSVYEYVAPHQPCIVAYVHNI